MSSIPQDDKTQRKNAKQITVALVKQGCEVLLCNPVYRENSNGVWYFSIDIDGTRHTHLWNLSEHVDAKQAARSFVKEVNES
jgi:hypothetical protein